MNLFLKKIQKFIKFKSTQIVYVHTQYPWFGKFRETCAWF